MLVRRAGRRVDDEKVELAPVDLGEELRDQPVLARPAPNHRLVRAGKHEADRHDAERAAAARPVEQLQLGVAVAAAARARARCVVVHIVVVVARGVEVMLDIDGRPARGRLVHLAPREAEDRRRRRAADVDVEQSDLRARAEAVAARNPPRGHGRAPASIAICSAMDLISRGGTRGTTREWRFDGLKYKAKKETPRRTAKPRPASANASWHDTVDLPTPPLPERTSSLRFTPASRAFTRAAVASVAAAAARESPDAHAFWLGQPSQLAALPACADSGPTQVALASAGGASDMAHNRASDIGNRNAVIELVGAAR